ncbi:PQQ-binding-like beta-propeller repeat protein [Verrucomicrobiota bacterium]
MKKVLVFCVAVFLSLVSVYAESGSGLIKASGVKGGLVVCVGADPATSAGQGILDELIEAGGDGLYLVHCLDTDQKKVDSARKYIQTKGLYGRVSVDIFDGKSLPYADNLVNLLVIDDQIQVSGKEIERVLAPRGTAMVKGDLKPKIKNLQPQSPAKLKGWDIYKKSVPPEIDEWTHFLHSAGNDAVSADTQVGIPKSLRWDAGPRWCRSHEFPSSVNCVVTSGGRIFTIFDEAPSGVFMKLPQKCSLIARDAASGVFLWKVPLRNWQPEFGTGEGNRWNIHHTIARRLIAKDDRVYVTLGFLNSPVSVLDAATGEPIAESLEGSIGADEIILSDDVLLVKTKSKRSIGATKSFEKDDLENSLVAIDVKTEKLLWRKENPGVMPYALAAGKGRVLFHNMDELVCLDLREGTELWRTVNKTGRMLTGNINLVVSDDIVLFQGNREKAAAEEKSVKKKIKQSLRPISLTAFSMKDGRELWSHVIKKDWKLGATQPADTFVINDTVWCGSFTGLDIRTGEIKKTIDPHNTISPKHHYRCHRSKATVNYLILPKRGAEFLDLKGDNHMRNDWLRAPCFAGLTPANGLLYIPPSQCFCYPGVLVSGFLAMSSDIPEKLKPSDESNLQQGPAYAQVATSGKPGYGKNPKSEIRNPKSDWPMYRHDVQRSGSIKTPVSTDLKKLWEVKLAAQGSQAVIVGDRLWVAEKDAHRIRCLDAESGKDVWSFIAGGRIDSAPTIYEGQRTEDRGQKIGTGSLCLFGCRDGSVYCLRAEDGALIWRFRAAPEDKRVVSFDQVESVWPVHGSVLVQDNKVYFAAGRSSFLDGGILVYALDVETGKVLHNNVLEGPWPDVKKDKGAAFSMEGALPDIFVSDGKNLYMRRIKFDSELNRVALKPQGWLGEIDMGTNHLVATGGFLDDTGFDRLYWMYSKWWPGFYFSQQSPKAGQLVVFDDATTYAVKYFYNRMGWSPLFIPQEKGYMLFADDNDTQPTFGEFSKNSTEPPFLEWLPENPVENKGRKGGKGTEKGTGYVRDKPAKWQKMIPVRVRAMLLSGEHIFTAGPPDIVDEKDPLAAFEGRAGSILQVFSSKDGTKLSEYKLDSEPVFDGISAADGKLFVSLKSGKIMCFE